MLAHVLEASLSLSIEESNEGVDKGDGLEEVFSNTPVSDRMKPDSALCCIFQELVAMHDTLEFRAIIRGKPGNSLIKEKLLQHHALLAKYRDSGLLVVIERDSIEIEHGNQ